MRKALTLILGCALFGIFAAVVVASQGADDPANHDTTTTGTVEQPTTTAEDNPARDRRDADAKQNEDVSGPCDEAEHANDPRCTGQPTAPQGDDGAVGDDRVDNSGPGSQNSGPGSVNSGRDDRGEAEVGDDHGGHGEVEAGDDRGGEAEAGDDHGGHGEVESGDDRGGDSGSGSSGSGGGGGHSGRG